MKRIITLITFLFLGGMLLTSTVGCNTMAGMGQDIESAGGAIEEKAEDWFAAMIGRFSWNEFQTAKELDMTFDFALQPLLAIVAGVLILFFPRLLNYIIAIYLIVYGVLSIVSP